MYALPVGITFLALASVTVALRLYARLHLVRKPGWDDLLIAVSLGTDIVFFVFLVIESKNGLAEDQEDLSPQEVRNQLKALWITIPLYNLSLTLTKLSLVFLYRRLFPTKVYRILLTITLVFVIISGLWMVFSTLLFCIPVSAFWNKSLPRTCLPADVVWCLNAGLQITTDLILVILPLPILARLKLPKRQKLALLVIFALGFFVCATSIVRLTTLIKLIRTPDFTEGNGLAATWSFVESNVAIICACLPPLRPLIIRFFPHLMPSRMRSTYREKPTKEGLNFVTTTTAANPFAPSNTSYVASITGNCSTNGGEQQQNQNQNQNQDGLGLGSSPEMEGIQIMRELRWDSYSVGSVEGDGGMTLGLGLGFYGI
ncbi:hypothetical protein BO94DRAFT_569878 [Aspergillus sclerotioniger CBS 115572]|uniref:Rhodopsin domain-containing protein n=1 Tax=Aspergillus sclerotioniger CBS 115572 TaxID=1450535 RepID=A0A317V6A6_9EURO|nr:hypothetical protein BO94DRAFT_569878 [Aspergillus sclerotioniger CBS 115572]PWY68578.1 hypothetical protein BO94DRAFT_569878 [Aspergillus sclerotioniger CBS 115572]